MSHIDKLKLAAFIITDGGIFEKRNQIFFDSTDEKLIQCFVATVKQLGIKNISINRGHGTIEVSFYSKKLVKDILKLIGKQKTINLNEILKLPKSKIKEILRILFSTDGGVSLSVSIGKDGKRRVHRKVTFTSKKNPENLKIVQFLLKLFDINSKIHGFDLEIKGKENLMKFQKLIGFIEGVKVTGKSKKWKGCEKNKLLEFVLNSFRDTHGE